MSSPRFIAPGLALALATLTALCSPAAAQQVGATRAALIDGSAHEGAVMCSAVLVAPQVALTAAHCVALVEADAADEGWQLDWWISFAGDVRSVEGPDPALPPLTVAVEATAVHPGFAAEGPPRSDRLTAAYDIAVLLLAEPAPVAPVPLMTAPLMSAPLMDAAPMSAPLQDASAAAIEPPAPVLIAGYGWTTDDPDAGQMGVRAAGASLLFEVGAHELRVGRRLDARAAPPAGLAEKCGGDSGGPTFLRTAAGWRVIGLTSRGHASDPGCTLAGIDTRVDVYAPWVAATVAEHAAGPRAAGGCAVADPRPARGALPIALGLILLSVTRRRSKTPS